MHRPPLPFISFCPNHHTFYFQPLLRPNRLLVKDGTVQKQNRKGLAVRQLYLFNDILVYGTPITKGKNKSQNVINLVDCMVTDVDDSAEGSNGFQINSDTKSFLCYADSAQAKTEWTANLKKYSDLSRSAIGMDSSAVSARAVWVSDKKVKKCMMNDCESSFTLTNRRHHCRNCGKCICGKCSKEKAILNMEKPERVCSMCYRKLGGNADNPATKIPKLGKASTETSGMGAAGAGDSSDSDSSDSDSDGDGDASTDVIAGSSAAVLAGTAGVADLSKSEKKMHEMSDEERAKLMQAVKEGTLTMDEALKRIEGGAADPADGGGDSSGVPAGKAYATALYANDDPEGPDELVFAEDQIIILTRTVNAEWLEGYINGNDESAKGIFPAAFVEVKVPL